MALQLGTETGSLINHLYSRATRGQPAPEVGMGATVLSWTDRRAATVVSVEPTKQGGWIVGVQEDRAKVISGSTHDGSAVYEYTRDPEGWVFHWRFEEGKGWRGVNQNDRGRADTARQRGHKVLTANFLQVDPSPTYDVVLMNPPFYGKHYQKHVEHARRFLKPGGRVLAILPITALTDHGYIEAGRWLRDRWEDLPVGAFSESGTNINTGIATFFRKD